MPRTRTDFKPMSGAERKRRFRQNHADDAEWLAKEKERKAAWYAANKERKAERQRQYRQSKREQMLMDLGREGLA